MTLLCVGDGAEMSSDVGSSLVVIFCSRLLQSEMQRMDLGLNAQQTSYLQDGTYQISNAHRGGAMFTSSRLFSAGGDHDVGLSPQDKEFGHGEPPISAGKWRWEVERQPDGSYKIASTQVGGALFLSIKEFNDAGDCKVGLSPEDKEAEEGNTGKWRWDITRELNGSFKISNKERGGALFCSKCQFDGHGGDFQVAWSPDDKEAVNGSTGKWRWHFRLKSSQPVTCSMRVSAEGMALVTCTGGVSGEELGTFEVERVATISFLVEWLSQELEVPAACELKLLDQEGNVLPHTATLAELLSGGE